MRANCGVPPTLPAGHNIAAIVLESRGMISHLSFGITSFRGRAHQLCVQTRGIGAPNDETPLREGSAAELDSALLLQHNTAMVGERKARLM
ncbi:hypothetical protein FB451DRAFT_1111333 [Mycena latifolia]|nr:hypothetical protein FB451DRAFT_1111333 [Mycena latifolia]